MWQLRRHSLSPCSRARARSRRAATSPSRSSGPAFAGCLVLDVLSLDGLSLMRAPHSERRARLEALDLSGQYWQTPEVFDKGPALFSAVWERELEGTVAKRRSSPYRSGARGWIKI